MEEGAEQNKSEPPSRFKLDKARKEGSVARGPDLGFATSLLALLGYGWLQGSHLVSSLSLAARRALVAASTVSGGADELLELIHIVVTTLIQPLLLFVGVIFVVVLALEVVQTGFVFSFHPLSPNFSKLNPGNGLKRVFSVRQLIETGKNLLKLGVYATLATMTIMDAAIRVAPAITSAGRLSDALWHESLHLLVLFTAAAVIIAGIDQVISRRDYFKRMRMSRHETKRETRDREGDPRFKQRRRQIHREYAKLSKSLKNVRGADVLITNPTHYAVALSYDVRTMNAPKIVAQGADMMALRLKRLAFLYSVVTIENRDLARSLYQRCDIGQEIPDTYYRTVADIYRHIRSQAPRHMRTVS